MSFLASIGSAVGGALSSVASDLLGNWQSNQYSKAAASKQFEREQFMMDKQFENDLEMWRKQNYYNSPANQMKRLEKAGLNPNLMYTNGNVGNATSMPTMSKGSASMASAPRAKYDIDFSKLMPLMQMENLNAQNKLINAQTIEAEERAKGVTLDNINKGIVNEYLPDKLRKENAVIGRNHNPLNRAVNGFLDLGNSLVNAQNNIFTDSNFRQSEMDYRKGLKNIYGNKWREHYLPPEKRYR